MTLPNDGPLAAANLRSAVLDRRGSQVLFGGFNGTIAVVDIAQFSLVASVPTGSDGIRDAADLRAATQGRGTPGERFPMTAPADRITTGPMGWTRGGRMI